MYQLCEEPPVPPEEPPPRAAPTATTNPIIARFGPPSRTSTPGGKYRKGNPQPRLRDLISLGLGLFSIGLPRKSFVFTKIVSPFLKVPFLLTRHVILLFLIL